MDEGGKLFCKLSDILHGKYDSKYTSSQINFSKIFPDSESSAKTINRLKKYIERVFNLVKNCKNDHEGLTTLLEAGLSNLFVEAFAVFKKEVAVEGVTQLLDDLLEIVNLIAESGEKSQSLLVTALCGPYLQLLVEESCTLLQKTEICRSLNILLETCPFATKEVLLKKTSFIGKLRDLFQLVIRVGDYELQIGILECLFRLLPRKIRPQYACKFLQQSILEKFLDIRDVNFETDCRLFLNEINRTVGNNGRVYSIPCAKAVLGKKQLRKPSDDEYEEFWLDFNYGSRRITLFCEQDDLAEADSQISQSELGLWETITVSTTDVKSYSYNEDNGHAIASIELKKTIGSLYPNMAKHQGKDFFLYVEKKYNMKKALMTVFGSEKCLTKKISSVITPVQLRVERNHDPKSIYPYDSAEPSSAGGAALPQCSQSSQRGYQNGSPKRVKMSVPCMLMSTPASSVGSPVVKTDDKRPVSSGHCVQETKSNRKDNFKAPKTPIVKQIKPKVKTPVVEVVECPKKKDTRKKQNKKKCVNNIEIGTDKASILAPYHIDDNDVIPDSFPGSQSVANFLSFPALSESGIDVTEVHRAEKITEQKKEIDKSRSESSKRPGRVPDLEQITSSSNDLPSSSEDMVIQETQDMEKEYQEDLVKENTKDSKSRCHKKRNKRNKSSSQTDSETEPVNTSKELTNKLKEKSPNVSTKAIPEIENNPEVSTSPVESIKGDTVRNSQRSSRKGSSRSLQLEQEAVDSELDKPSSKVERKTNANIMSSPVHKENPSESLSDEASLVDDVFEEESSGSPDNQETVIVKDSKKSEGKKETQNIENVVPKRGNSYKKTMSTNMASNKDLRKKYISSDCENQVENNIKRKDNFEAAHPKRHQGRKDKTQSREENLRTTDNENHFNDEICNTFDTKKQKRQQKKKNKDEKSEETDMSNEKINSKDVRKLPSRKAKQNQVYDESKNESNSGSLVTAGFLFRSPGETVSSCSSVTSYAENAKSNQPGKKGGRKLLNQSGLYFPDHTNGSQESDPYDFDAECDTVPNMPVAKYSSKSDGNLQQNKTAAVTSKFFKHRTESRKLNRTAETIATTYMKSWQQQLNKKKGNKTKVLSQSVVSWKSVEHFEDQENDESREKKAKEVKNNRKSKKENSKSKKIVSTSLKENRKEVDESFNMPTKKKTNASKFKLFNPDLSVLMPTEEDAIENGDESNAEMSDGIKEPNPTSNEPSPNLNIEESETENCHNQLPDSPCHKNKKQRGKPKGRQRQKKEKHRESPINSPCNSDVAENLSNMCKTLLRSSRLENGAESNQRQLREKKCDNMQVQQQRKQVPEESDGELSEENRTIATSVRSELSWIAKKTASRRKKIKKTYKRNVDLKKRSNDSSDEDIVIESLRFRDEEKDDLVMNSQEWGVPTQFSIEDVVTPRISSIKTPNIPSSKKRYSPLDVKFVQTPRTPKTPASFHFSDEDNELLVEEDDYNYDVQVPKAMDVIREYVVPLKDDNFTTSSSMKKIQSGPSSAVRPSRSTLKRKYSHLNLQDEEVNSPESSQGNQIDQGEDIADFEFCPRKLFKRNALQVDEIEEDGEQTDVKTPNQLKTVKQKTSTKIKTSPLLDIQSLPSPSQESTSYKQNKKRASLTKCTSAAFDMPCLPSPIKDTSSHMRGKKQKKIAQMSALEMPSLSLPLQDMSSLINPQMLQLQSLLGYKNESAMIKKPKKKAVPEPDSDSESELETSESEVELEEEQEEEQASLWSLHSTKKRHGGRKTQGCKMVDNSQFQFMDAAQEDELTQSGDADTAFDLTSDMGIETGISTVVQAFGIDIQKQLKTKYQQLKEITNGALKNSQKHVRNIWCEEYEHRGRALEHFKDKMLEELLHLETDVTALAEAEERSLNFCLQQKETMDKNRKSQETRLRNLKILYSSLQCSLNETENESIHKQKKLKQIMKADLATLQKRLLFESNQHHISNVKKCLKSMIF